MLEWKPKHKHIREAALHLLGSPEAKGKLYTMGAFAEVITAVVNKRWADSNKGDSKKVTENMLKLAFGVPEKHRHMYSTALNIKGCNDVAVIGIGIQRAKGSARAAYIGRFNSLEDGDNCNAPVQKIPSLNRHVNKWRDLSVELERQVHQYIAKESKNKKKSKQEAAVEREAKRKRPSPEEIEAGREAKRLKHLEDEKKKIEARIVTESKKTRESLNALKQAEEEYRALLQSNPSLGSLSTRPSPMMDYSNDPNDGPVHLDTMLRFIYKGRAGEIPLPSTRKVVLVEELLDSSHFKELPEGTDNEKADEMRERRGYHVSNFGVSQGWTPNGSTNNASNKQSTKEDSHAIVTAIRDLFGGKQCKFDEESLRYFAAFTSQAYGASDEAVEMIIAGWTKALFHQVGLDDISARDIANGLPSKSLLARLEVRLAADCLATRLMEIIDDGATFFALVTDHGKRAGMEHFVKLLCWFGKDKNGNETIKYHCIDVDTSNHTGRDCARAIERSLAIFTGQDGFEVTCITGDAGGGAAVQHLLPHLQRLGAVAIDCSKINCNLHALNKCLESSLQDVLGKQGIGRRTPFQLLFVFNQLWKRLKEEAGDKYLDEIFALTMNELATNDVWKDEAEKKFPQAFRELMDKFAELESEEDDDGIDGLVSLLTERPKNLQDPVFSRWQTILKLTKTVTEHWVVIYFVAVAVKQDTTSGSYLWQLSCALLSLMNTSAEPIEDENTLDEYIESFNDNNTNEGYDLPSTKEKTPTFYAMLLWIQGFAESYFDDMFEFLMRSDPVLGNGSWGQTARLAVERCYVMHDKLKELENGGWKNKPQFAPYLKALEKVPNAGDVSNAGKEFFNEMPEKILKKFRSIFEKHVVSCWCSDDILHYIIGGNPTLAKHFAAWLVHYKTNEDAASLLAAGSSAVNEDIEVEAYEFPNESITLEHHKVRNGDIVVNIRDCMTYLTANADIDYILKRRFVKNHWEQIMAMSIAEETVDLFDEDTWVGHDFTSLKEAVLKEICIHPVHQQRCENYVQLAALISQTHVGEVRRTARAIIISTIIRLFNKEALEEKKRRVADPNTKDKAKKARRVEGADRTELLIKFLDVFNDDVLKAKRHLGDDTYGAIKKHVSNKKSKMSEEERKKRIQRFEKSIKMTRTEVKAEQSAGVDVTATMGGRVTLSLLLKKYTCASCKKDPDRDCTAEHCAMAAVHEEIRFRQIKMKNKNWKKELTIQKKRDVLRKDELKLVAADGDKAKQGIKLDDIKDIKPQSDKMKAMLQHQEQLRAES